MPSINCPQCAFAVTYLDDLIGTLQCPGCGEDILHGRQEPHWDEEALQPHRRQIEASPVHQVELEEDTDEAELRATTVAAEPLPGVAPETRPGGIAVAGATWIFTGVLALVVNVPLFVLLVILTLGERTQEGLSPVGVVLLGAILLALAGAFYVALIRAGRNFRKGAYRHVQFPAWLVLLVADGLLLLHAYLAFPLLSAPLGQSPGPLVASAGLVVAVCLGALDLLLIFASAALLWQSGRYAHWARGAIHRPVASADRSGFPNSVTFAARGWLLIGLVTTGLAAFLAYRMLVPGLTGADAVPGYLYSGAVIVVALTPLLLGFALLHGRLSSTIVPGWTFLIVTLALLFCALYAWSSLPVGGAPGAPAKEILDWQRTTYLIETTLCGLGLVASMACLIGDEAYRGWLRGARGLHV